MPEPFSPPPRYRIDSVLWWLIRDRSSVALTCLLIAFLVLYATMRVNLYLIDVEAPWPFAVLLGSGAYLLSKWLCRRILMSWRRRLAWQEYWDHVYRDGTIIRSKP